VAGGLTNVTAGAWTGDQPAGNISWYEAAAFVNWLNTSTGHQAAYDLTWNGSAWTMNLWSSADAWQAGGENLYRHKDAFYFLPSEDEWYKAAYHKNDGVTANYFLYATGSDAAPTPVASGTLSGSAVYNAQSAPAVISQAGGASPYGTIGQGGNLWEWSESSDDGLNNSPTANRVVRGGSYQNLTSEPYLRADWGGYDNPNTDNLVPGVIGFRVASIPEPSAGLLIFGAGLLLSSRRRRIGSR
jgi:formylglycine-generating enzyme required for sulfatase activity